MAHNSPAAVRPYSLVVGLGQTGLSLARFMARQGTHFVVTDSRSEPPALAGLRDELPQAECRLGGFDPDLFAGASELLMSPGVPLDDPAIVAARQAGVPIYGDIELFARHAEAPVVAITGSNGKSTVTTLVGEMIATAGLAVQVGGNIGVPALELFDAELPDYYVLELSSFQLELTASLEPVAAVVLNISDDHLDRHGDITHYAALKARIFHGRGIAVINRDDPLVAAMGNRLDPHRVTGFALAEPELLTDFGLIDYRGEQWLARGQELLIKARALRIAGRHNIANALAALALGTAIELPREAMLETLRRFPGLPHRCQWVGEVNGANWYNDSKGTNVGATVAALAGMPGEKVVLIAGGQGKGADFSPLAPAVAARARAVVLIGEDAPLIEQALGGRVAVEHAGSMGEAVAKAAGLAQRGDSVLLSPACASFDMFHNYQHRGECFAEAVRGLGR